MKKAVLSFLLIGAALAFISPEKPIVAPGAEDKVADVLQKLGDVLPNHLPNDSIAGVSVERGRDIVLHGITSRPDGGKTGKQSKHFVCTSCHNVEREDPDLSVSDPQTRLLYVNEKGMPFLQGTTLYGAVNRTSFYNGDYEKKYGSLVEKARKSLRESIQLCAVECSQGRRLEPWEMESVLSYLWTIGLKMGDLQLSESDYRTIEAALSGGKDKQQAIGLIKAHYLQGSPATFVDPPGDRSAGYAYNGEPENGKLIYERSCLHCHENERYSFFRLDHSAQTFAFLEKHIPQYTRYSLYQVGRYGTSPVPGKRAYMPNYTLEKMSHQQMEDLRAYIEAMAQ